MKSEFVADVLDYLQKLQLRLPKKIKKKRELKRVNSAINLTRDVIIVDAVIKNGDKTLEKGGKD